MVEGEIRKKTATEQEEKRWPPWVKPLLSTKFFTQCKNHTDLHKRECNMYCLDCTNGPLCSFCLSCDHHGHHTIQIRRSSYHDVIRISDIQREFDISGVQTYVINSARVIFLNERPQPQPRPPKAVSNSCRICSRGLLDNFTFCSLSCKIAGTRNENQQNKIGKEKLNLLFASEEPRRENVQSSVARNFDPVTPPLTVLRGAKRRKGIPRRAPFGSLVQ